MRITSAKSFILGEANDIILELNRKTMQLWRGTVINQLLIYASKVLKRDIGPVCCQLD
jgi:hypothetical protein